MSLEKIDSALLCGVWPSIRAAVDITGSKQKCTEKNLIGLTIRLVTDF